MIYQIDLDISDFKKYELEKILDLSHFIKCDDNKIDTFRLVKDKSYFFELKHMGKNETFSLSNFNKLYASLFIEFKYEENLNFTHVPVDKIMTTKYSDFDEGEYLVVMINLKSYEISLQILETFENYTAIAGCFGFDVEKEYKILSYVKIRSK